MKLERLMEIESQWKSGDSDAKWIPELIEAVKDSRKAFTWIKNMENEFYDQVKLVHEGNEIRILNPKLEQWGYIFKSLFGTVNESLDSRWG